MGRRTPDPPQAKPARKSLRPGRMTPRSPRSPRATVLEDGCRSWNMAQVAVHCNTLAWRRRNAENQPPEYAGIAGSLVGPVGQGCFAPARAAISDTRRANNIIFILSSIFHRDSRIHSPFPQNRPRRDVQDCPGGLLKSGTKKRPVANKDVLVKIYQSAHNLRCRIRSALTPLELAQW